jgi:hypothetical protein
MPPSPAITTYIHTRSCRPSTMTSPQVYDMFQDEKSVYVVMQHFDAGDLSDWIGAHQKRVAASSKAVLKGDVVRLTEAARSASGPKRVRCLQSHVEVPQGPLEVLQEAGGGGWGAYARASGPPGSTTRVSGAALHVRDQATGELMHVIPSSVVRTRHLAPSLCLPGPTAPAALFSAGRTPPHHLPPPAPPCHLHPPVAAACCRRRLTARHAPARSG